MKCVIAGLIVFLIVFMTMAMCRAASDADDQMEQLFRERK